MTTPARGSARSRRHYVTAGLAAMPREALLLVGARLAETTWFYTIVT
ncbi:hypothetical protein PJ900_03365 (plasmid) [Tistrella mobilis]|jgi:hypothetical protein|nr:hypothetical protein [Tistrella mobilis]